MIAAVVLAAGAATRFGAPKQRLLLPEVLERVRASGVDEIVVVAGAYPLEPSADTRIVECSEWERGPGASLRCGLAALRPEVDAALVVLADGPDLDPRAAARVLARRGEGPVVAASYDGVRLHPVLLEREAWSRIPDDGARSLEAVEVNCSDLDPPGDVDSVDDLPERLKRRTTNPEAR
jgi:CTP:molybdopterin cytidylyltransferase MocA